MTGDISQLMKQAQQMQAEMKKAQDEMGDLIVTGESGAGMVKITMTCKYHVQTLEIEDSLIGDDKEMLEDLIIAAFNDAIRRIEKTIQGSVALVFGKEDRGLTNEGLDLCHQLAIIPTATEHPSLNLAQACLVLCYEIQLACQKDTPPPLGKRNAGPANHKDVEEMHLALKQGLHQMGFFKGDRHPESILRMLRTLLSRAEPDLRETRLVRAIGFEMSKCFKGSEKP